VEKHVESRDEIRQFLKGMFGGRGPNGEVLFSPIKGILFENLHKIEGSGALSSEMLEFYTDEFLYNGLRGPLNWYRTREINFKDDKL